MPKLSVLVSPSTGGRADDVVARLREAMYLGILQPGDQLPAEVDLARQFATPPSDQARERLAELTLSQLRDLVDEHEAVSGQAAALAAERAAEGNLRRLVRLADELQMATTPAECIRADSRFHVEVAVAAQSERLTRQEVRLQAEICGMLWFPDGPAIAQGTLAAEHHAIAAAIADGDADLARRHAQRHVRNSMARLTELHLHVTEQAE